MLEAGFRRGVYRNSVVKVLISVEADALGMRVSGCMQGEDYETGSCSSVVGEVEESLHDSSFADANSPTILAAAADALEMDQVAVEASIRMTWLAEDEEVEEAGPS